MKIGLFFGSFNPIHIGHLIIAESMLNESDLSEIWFVVSPQNPFKEKRTLLNEYDRFYMVEVGVENNSRLKACNVEFNLSKPSYTIDTLTALTIQFPKNEFCILMGEDNLVGLPKWKGYEAILEHYPIYVYPRLGVGTGENNHPNVHRINAPIIEISATRIWELLSAGKSVRYLVS